MEAALVVLVGIAEIADRPGVDPAALDLVGRLRAARQRDRQRGDALRRKVEIAPVVWRASSAAWTRAASASGASAGAGIFTLPEATIANSSRAILSSRARSAMKVNRVGRVTNSEPFCASNARLKDSIPPDAEPKLASRPNGRRQSSEAGKVALPTPS